MGEQTYAVGTYGYMGRWGQIMVAVLTQSPSKKWHMGGQPHCRQQECDPNSQWLCDRGDLDIRVTKTTADMEQIIPYAYSIDL